MSPAFHTPIETPSRRRFLTALTAVGAGALLPGCPAAR